MTGFPQGASARPRAIGSARLLGGILILATVALAGCYHGTAHDVSPAALHARPGWNLVDGMKMVRQSTARDCGAAALSMMLERWGTPGPTSADVLRDVSFDEKQGIAAGALRDLARQRGLIAYLIPGQFDDLVHEIQLDRPVLVGLVQQYGQKAFAHYEVVVGINSRERRILLFDPARGPREDGFDGFSTEWKGAKQLALVVTGKSGATPGATAGASP